MKVFHNGKSLHYGNLMISYLVANRLARDVGSLVFSNFWMPYWNIFDAPINFGDELPRASQWNEQRFDFARAAYLLNSDLVNVVEYHGYGQRLENFPPVEVSRRLFRAPLEIGQDFGSTKVVCPIRAGDILSAPHPGYTLLPINFYRDIFDKLQLEPVFVGQTNLDNPYTFALRRAFADVTFIDSQGPLHDFQTIRRAKTLVLPVSTFAWLSGWLSSASKIILPVFGLYNQKHYPEHDLLPLADRRYSFFLFPVQDAVPVDKVGDAHADIDGQWHQVEAKMLLKI